MQKCRHKISGTYLYGLFATARIYLHVQINSLSSAPGERETERELEPENFILQG